MVARKPRMRESTEDKVGGRAGPSWRSRLGLSSLTTLPYAHSIATKHSKLTMSQGILNLKE